MYPKYRLTPARKHRSRSPSFTEFLEPRLLLAATVQLVSDLRPGAAGSSPAHLTAIDNTLFFTADDGQHGASIWKIDPASSSVLLATSVQAANLTSFKGKLVFTSGKTLMESN